MNAMTMTPNVSNLYLCSPREVKKFAIRVIRAGLVPFIRSSPGMGKSSIVREIAEEFDLCLLDERLSTRSPVDLAGLPNIHGAGELARATFTPFDMFPVETTELPINPKTGLPFQGWLLFLDEFNSALKSVQAASYKLVLDRMVGLLRLHPNVVIVLAGNLSTDRAITTDLSTAMQSRVIHLIMETERDDQGIAFNWLNDVAFKNNYDDRIIGFHHYTNFDHLNDFRPDHQENTFSCQRTWEFMDRLLIDPDTGDRLPVEAEDIKLFAGTITSGVAASFVNFCEVFGKVPDISDILNHPASADVPDDAASRWAVISMVMGKVTAATFKDISTYVNRFSADFRILFFRSVMARFPQLKGTPEFGKAMSELARYLHE